MKTNRMIKILLFILFFAIIGNGCFDSNSNSTPQSSNESISQSAESKDLHYEESEGFDFDPYKMPLEDYYGSWKATSKQAEYYYGNVSINIYKDGSWNGNIADVDINGKWNKSDNGIKLSSDIVNLFLVYTDSSTLLMQEDRGGETINTVLTKI